MRTKIAQLTLFSTFVLIAQFSQAQSGLGIGTSNPNPNAILDIVSVSNNKGVLIPRLTTAQRTAMNTALSASENGLMVFDLDLHGFYFWNGTDWSAITVVQDLQLVGSKLTITNNSAATNIDLSAFSGTNTDNQTLSLTGTNLAITGGNTLDLSPIQDGVNDADSNPTNELQNLSSSSSGTNRTVAITGGTNATFNIADNDNSTTNELVTGATLVGTTLRITDAGGNTDVNLAPLQGGTAGGDLTGTYPNPTVAANVIGSAEIINNTISTLDILNFTITDIDVSGLAAIAGTKIRPNFGSQHVQTFGEYEYLTPKSHIYAVGPSDFVVLKNFFTQDFQMLYGVDGLEARVGTAAPEGAANFGAPIHLPDGAIVTEVEIVGRNASSVFAGEVYFIEKSYSTGTAPPTLLATIPTSTSAISNYFATGLNITINNNLRNYLIRVEGSTNGVSITGVKIIYLVTQAD